MLPKKMTVHIFDLFVKFGYYEKATKFEKKIHLKFNATQ